MSKSKAGKYPLSPRLAGPSTPPKNQNKDRFSTSYLSLANKNLSNLPTTPAAVSPARAQMFPSTNSANLLYLDLQNNQLTTKTLKNIGPNVLALDLSYNPLNSCAIPVLSKLRTLSLDNCGIKSFEGFPYMPTLKFVSFANNKITSFKGLPILPTLESIVLSNNPVEFDLKMTIQAVGSICLHQFNRQEITAPQLKEAFKLSPIVGISLRAGRDPTPQGTIEEENRFSQDYLTRDLNLYRANEHAKYELSLQQYREALQVIEDEKKELAADAEEENVVNEAQGKENVNPNINVNNKKGKKAKENKQIKEEPSAPIALEIPPDSDIIPFPGEEPKLPSELEITQTEEGYNIVCPYKSTNTKWYRNKSPDKDGFEWVQLPLESKDTSTLPVTMMIRMHLIKCEFTMDGKTYTIYTRDPIGKDKRDLCLPFPLDPIIVGTPSEGSTVSLMPIPIPVRVAWTKESETIAQDVDSILLTHKEINAQIACLLQPYCPNLPQVAFATVLTVTEAVAPLLPTVAGITFPDTILEDRTIEFSRILFPDREGESQILLEKSKSPSTEWELIRNLTQDHFRYTPQNNDVGYYLRISYTPVTAEGTTGETRYFYSQTRVLASMPIFKHPIIGGLPKTSFPLVALADYIGGTKGKCMYDWYFSKRPIDVKKGPTNRLRKVAHDTQFFTPTKDMADGFLAVQMIPIRSDDVSGKPVFCALDTPITLDDPPKPLDGLPSEVIVGKKIVFPTTVDIFLSKTTGFCGFDMLKTANQYTPSEKHLGRIVRLVNDNVDVILGEIKPSVPQIISLSLSATSWNPGSIASISCVHKHVKTNRLEVVWFRCVGKTEIPIALDTSDYTITNDDMASRLKVVATPLDAKGKRLESVSTSLSPVIRPHDLTTPIIVGDTTEGGEIEISCPAEIRSIVWYRKDNKTKYTKVGEGEKYVLTREELGKNIRADVTLEETGILIKTESKWIVGDCLPYVDIEMPTKIVEGDVIKPKVTYHGGLEGRSLMRWYRETDTEGWEMVSENLNYQTTEDDVDCVLKFVYIPFKRLDNVQGDENSIECGPVDPLPPCCAKATIKQNVKGNLEVVAKYKGGHEGQSFVIWRMIEGEEITNIGKTLQLELTPPPNVIGKTVDAIYVPVRSDGVTGEPVTTKNRIVVQGLPTVFNAEILVKGKMQAGCLLRCKATASPKTTLQYQWHRGDGTNWEPIADAVDVEFSPTEEEVGFYILCAITAVDSKGWKSPQFAATAIDLVKAQKEMIPIKYEERIQNGDDNEIVESHGRLWTGMTISTLLTPLKLKEAHIVWQKEIDGEWKSVSHTNTYLVTVNDIGFRFRAISRKSNVSEPTPIAEMNPQIISFVRAAVRANNLQCTSKTKVGSVIWKLHANAKNITLTSQNKNKLTASWNTVVCDAVANSSKDMSLVLDDSTKFVLIPNLEDPRLVQSIYTNNVRDYVVASIRGFVESHKSK